MGGGERKGGRGQGIGGIGEGSEEGMKDGGKRGKGKWEEDWCSVCRWNDM